MGELIARGAYSVIHAARRVDSGLRCVIKTPARDTAKRNGDVLTANENEVLRHIGHHPTLPLFYGAAKFDDGRPGTMLEYFPFPSLDKHLGQWGVLLEDDAVHVVRQLLRAVVYLGGRGIFHRDIKPENILYEAITGGIKLIDFGLAHHDARIADGRYAPTDAMAPGHVGTPLYMAPEVLGTRGRDVLVFVAESWCVGMTAVALLQGHTLFHRVTKESGLARVHASLATEPDALVLGDVSVRARAFIRTSLEPSAARRPTPDRLLAFLVQLYGDQPAHSAPATARLVPVSHPRRRATWPTHKPRIVPYSGPRPAPGWRDQRANF